MSIKIIGISGKTSDMFSLLTDENTLYYGYVPLGSLGGGDYIEMEIDNATGQILNWKPSVEADLTNMQSGDF